MSMKNRFWSALLVLATAITVQVPAWASPVDILRSVELEIKSYPEAERFPGQFSTAEQVLSLLDGNTSNLLVRMEALRRGYHQLSYTEQERLLDELFKRQRAQEHDLLIAFDHGYAQMLYRQNKTGLYFLRKANDRFADQFSSLAYAMAEAEADINIESALPDVMTQRKLDVIFKMTDAVKRDANNHQPGFWTSFVRVVDKLRPIGAYQSFVRRDFSLNYLPYGNKVIPLKGTHTDSQSLYKDGLSPLLTSSTPTPGECNPVQQVSTGGQDDLLGMEPAFSRTINFNGMDTQLQFFRPQPDLYHVRVLMPDGQPALSFKSNSSSVVEDLDGDGIYEIVARKYFHNPLTPVSVYRYNAGCGFVLDQSVHEAFHH